MLQISLPAKRMFNEQTQEFIVVDAMTLKLEHSLISIHRWESKWHKSYMSSQESGRMTVEEAMDYIRCMSLDPNISLDVIGRLSNKNLDDIRQYISDPMTATTFGGSNRKKGKKQIITAELVYYWMTAYGIPFECAKWHFNQLMALIHVCSIKNAPTHKQSKKQSAANYAALNKARRARTGSSG